MACGQSVVGKSLWNYVKGCETASFLNAVLFAVRYKQHPFETTYRCDSPNQPRLFRMHVEPCSDEKLVVRHVLLSMGAARSPKVIAFEKWMGGSRCSMCCHFRVGDEWLDPFDAPDTKFFPSEHVICPDCKLAARAALGEAVKGRVLSLA
jgi:hypothetical protein